MPRCPKCSTYKDVSLFGKDSTKPSGFDTYCKSCRLDYRNKNRELERKRNYRWMDNNKEKVACRYTARKYFKVRKKCCVEFCENMGERHHIDYNKPLEIIWLCHKHHKSLHAVQKLSLPSPKG